MSNQRPSDISRDVDALIPKIEALEREVRIPEAWRAFVYSNSWRSYLGGAHATWGTAGYYRDAIGRVHFHGMIDKNGGNFVANELMITLPTGFRPISGEMFSPRMAGSAGENNGRVDVNADGTVMLVQGGTANPVSFVALSQIASRAEQ